MGLKIFVSLELFRKYDEKLYWQKSCWSQVLCLTSKKNHLPFGKGSGISTCFHEAGSYYKVQVEESKAQSATLTSARQRREDTTGKVRGEKRELLSCRL